MTTKIDISSTAIEKGLDMVKAFVEKLIGPTVEETGLLIREKLTLWRLRNQVKMLAKAQEYCEKNKISTKVISLKLLFPLLENASLEEDEALQDKWAILLSNLADSEQNIENHVFPYILGQISINEFSILEKTMVEKREKVHDLDLQLSEFKKNKDRLRVELKNREQDLERKIAIEKKKNCFPFAEPLKALEKENRKVKMDLLEIKYTEGRLLSKIHEPQSFPTKEVKEFEISNLVRLGLIKVIQKTYANSQTLKIPNQPEEEFIEVDLDVEVESEIDHILTQLGEMFIDACTEKRKRTNIE